MNQWYIVINPRSAGGKATAEWEKIGQLLQENKIDYTHIFTEYPQQATELVKNAIEKGFRKIVAIGGDGTLNEVMNGIFVQKVVASTEIEFAVIPVGTGSDWIRTHKIPKRYNDSVALLKNGTNIFQDVGIVKYWENGKEKMRYFMNVAGFAYDAFVGEKTYHVSKAGLGGTFYYLYLTIKCLGEYESANMTIEGEGFKFEGRVFLANAGICRYSGGGMQLVPLSIPDDGLFDITIIEHLSPMQILWHIPKVYIGKTYGIKKSHHYRTSWLKVSAKNECKIEVEGEVLGQVPVELSILHKALKLRVAAQ
jgi:YegS/Rv2252/BmrU family lipid kinase